MDFSFGDVAGVRQTDQQWKIGISGHKIKIGRKYNLRINLKIQT